MLTLQNEIQKIGMEISEKIQYERIYEKIQWSLSILYLVVLPIWLLLYFIQLVVEIRFLTNTILLVLFILFFLTFFFITYN